MPKISDLRRTQRREQIIVAAMSCVAQEGFHRTTMADVITASGLSAGAVYGYFASKDDLILALADRAISMIEPVFDELLATDPTPSLPEAIAGITAQAQAMAQDNEDLLPVAVAAWAEAARNVQIRGQVSDRIMRLRNRFTELALRLQQQGRLSSAIDAVSVGQAAAGTIPGFLLQRLLFNDIDPSHYAAGLAAMTGVEGVSD